MAWAANDAFQINDDLGDAPAVTQINEDQAALIAAPIHPTSKPNRRTGVFSHEARHKYASSSSCIRS